MSIQRVIVTIEGRGKVGSRTDDEPYTIQLNQYISAFVIIINNFVFISFLNLRKNIHVFCFKYCAIH